MKIPFYHIDAFANKVFSAKACILNVLLLFIACILSGCSEQSNKFQNKPTSSGYIHVKNGRLFYQKFGSGGTPIIVLHGGPGLDQSYLLPQMLELAKNHEVIFYDQRGSGKSLETKLDTTFININQFVDDLEKLRVSLGIKKFIVLGHSWGGLHAMNYVIAHPDRVSALILMSSAPADFKGQQAFINEFTKRTMPIKTNIQPLFDNQAFQKLNASDIWQLYRTVFSVYFYHPDDVAKLTLNMSEKSAKSGATVMKLMQKTSWLTPNINLFPQLKKLSMPTLIIHGKQDIVPLWTAEEIKNSIPHSKIIILDQCGHFPYIEQPRETFSEINKFLSDNGL